MAGFKSESMAGFIGIRTQTVFRCCHVNRGCGCLPNGLRIIFGNADIRYQFPPRIIAHAVWLYLRFNLSLREVEEMLLERGIDVSYETVRRWIAKFGPQIARNLRRQA
ncbi:hypothetical protein NOI24_30135, partial [Neorhizobium galegae]|nr:hypothetical protein [Neorhizobium galegae]